MGLAHDRNAILFEAHTERVFAVAQDVVSDLLEHAIQRREAASGLLVEEVVEHAICDVFTSRRNRAGRDRLHGGYSKTSAAEVKAF